VQFPHFHPRILVTLALGVLAWVVVAGVAEVVEVVALGFSFGKGLALDFSVILQKLMTDYQNIPSRR
jgi:hypothetical protein